MSLDKTLLGIAKSAVDTQQKSRDGRNVVSKGVDAVTNKSYANEDKKVAAAALRKWENSTWKPKVEAKLKQELKTRAPHLKPGSKAYQQTYDSLFNKNYKDLQSAKAKAQQQIGTLRQKGQTQRQVDNEYSQKEAARNNNTKLQAASSAARDTGEAVSGALATGSSRALRYPLQLAADIGENDDGGIFDRGAKALERHEDNLQQVYPAYADIQQNGNFGQKLALSAVEQIPNLALSFTGAGAAAKGAQVAGAGANMTAATAYGTAAATMYPQAYGDGNDSTKQELENATPEQLRVAVRSKDIYKDHFDKNIKAGMSEDEAHQKSRDQTISSIAEESGDAVGLATLALSMIAPGVGSFTANQAAGGAVSKFGQKVFNKLAAKADAGKVAKYAIPTAVGTGIVGLNVAEEALQEGYTDYKAQQAAVDVGVKDKINQPQLKEAMLMGGVLGGLMGGGTYVGTRNSKFQQAQDGLREAQDTYAQAAAIIPQLQQQIEEVSPRSAEGQALTAQLEETKAALSTMAAEAETRGIPKTSLARRAPRIDPTNSFDTDFNGQVDGATELSEQDFENALNPDVTPAPQVTPAAPVMSEQELDIQDAQLAEFIAEQHALDEAIEDGSNDKPVEQSLAEAQNWYDSKRGEGKQGLSGVVSRAAATEQDAAFAQQQEGIKGATASINDYIASERAKQQQIDGQLQQEAEAATTDAEKQAVAQKIEQRDAERAKEDDILEAREQLAQPYENELFDTTIIGADGAPFKLARFWDSSLPAGAKAKAIADAFGGQIDQNVAKSDWANLPEGVQKELHQWFTERLNGVRQSREGAVAQAGEQVAAPAVEQEQEVAPTGNGLTMPQQTVVQTDSTPATSQLTDENPVINIPAPGGKAVNVATKPTVSSKVSQALIDKYGATKTYGREPWQLIGENDYGMPIYQHQNGERITQKASGDNLGAEAVTPDSYTVDAKELAKEHYTKEEVEAARERGQARADESKKSVAPTTEEGVYKSGPIARGVMKRQKLDTDRYEVAKTAEGFVIRERKLNADEQESLSVKKALNLKEGQELGDIQINGYKKANAIVSEANYLNAVIEYDGDNGRIKGTYKYQALSNSTPTPQQNTTAPSNDAAIGKDGLAKWFGSNDKAQSFIDKKGIADTHEVVSAGKSRFEIQPKAEGTPQADVAKAETVSESQDNYERKLVTGDRVTAKNNNEYEITNVEFNSSGGVNSVSTLFIPNPNSPNADKSFSPQRRSIAEFNNMFGSRVGSFEAPSATQSPKNITDEQFAELTSSRTTPSTPTGEKSAPAKRAEAKKVATEKTQNDVAETEATPKKKTAAELRASLLDNNKIISKDKAEEYKKTLKSRLSQANTGFDVEAFVAASGLAVAYIEGGIRSFNDFATLLVDDVGVKVKKYLLPAWEGARAYDDLDTEGMTSTEDARAEFNALVADGFFDEAKAEPEQASTPAKSKHKETIKSNGDINKLIGENEEGLPIYENDEGIRVISHNNGMVLEKEKYTVAPTDSGLQAQLSERSDKFKTTDELSENDDDTEAGTQDKAGAQEVRARGSDPQSGNAQDDNGDVAQGQPTDDSTTGQSESTGRSSVRGAGTDVADDGAVPGSENATDGRKGASGEGAPNVGAGKSETGSQSGRVAAVKSPAATAAQATDLLIDNPLEIVGGTPVQRFNRNRAALELLDQLEVEGRQATTEEQKVLAAYIGWGSFGQDLFQGSWEYPKYRDEGVWKERSEWLRNMMGKENWESAQRSITNAHYTDPPTVMAMWDMLARMGFDGGRVLEPSMGTGNFFSMMPADIKSRSQLTGIELDEMTGAIAKQLFPQSNVQIMGYQDSKTPDNFYDVVVGNWPFENTPVADRKYNKFNPMLHDYFFLKTMDQVRPGGIVIGITSAGSMDKKNTVIRGELAKQAELISAIRLPSGAFKDYAGTSVVTDIVILRKRPEKLGMIPQDATWVNIGTYDRTPSGKPVEINQYYLDNPQNIIGTLDYGSGATQFPGMIVRRPDNMSERLQQAIELVPENVIQEDTTTDHITYYANKAGERHGSLFMQDDKLMLVRGDQAVLAQDVVKYEVKSEKTTKEREGQIKDAIDLRRKYSALVDAERANEPAETQRKALKDAYKSFVKNNGPLRESYALKYMLKANDPFYFELAALEDDAGNHAAIMDKSTTRGMKTLENPSIRDAYVLARNQSVSPSVKEIAKLSKKTEAEVKRELKESGAVIEAPNGDLIPSDIYLSGNVRQKLREAQAAFDDGNKAMKENIAALQNVVPEDIPYFNIETKLGATWVPIESYQDYLASMLGLDSSDGIEVTFVAGRWKVRLKAGMDHTSAARTNYGTAHYKFSDLAQAAIRNQTIKIMKTDPQGDKYYDAEASNEVNARIGKIREDFGTWLWSDPERRVDLEREYNESRNAWATPKYDGSFLTFEGMALTLGQGEFSLREHQANAIWRAIVNRRSLNAHEVGTGKTFTMGGIAIESRRYGIAKKPIILAHNANSAAVAAEIRMMYPSSRVLYIDNLEPKNRELRLRQIANDDWDAIVMPHSLVDRLSLTEETLMRMAADDIAALEAEFYATAAEAGIDVSKVDLDDEESVSKVRSRTAKEMAKTRKRVIEGIKKQAQQASKAGAVSFEDLGIDMILVDEVHEFKKPPIVTSMDMKGLNTDVSQRSIQLQFLTRYVRQMNNGGNVHTFTGTPITNTITEIYHQMRYVMDSEMEKVSVSDWDGWFGSFATEVQDVELTSAGDYEMTTRLAGFINVPELRQMVGQYMDTVFAEDMPEMQPRRTDSGKTMADDNLTEKEKAHLLNGRTEGAKDRPYKKVINDSADMTPLQEAAFAEVQRLAGEWRDASGKQKREWVNKNDPRAPFAYTNMAEKASADVRLLDPSLVGKEGQTNDDPNSKTSRAIRNIMEIYHSDKDANQVIFMDKGYNKTATRSTGNRDENKKMIYEKVDVFSPVADMVERLVQSGIPREQIAVVTGSTKKEDRHRIAQAVNNSEIRVVIGSTQTLGVGVNMQRNLRAMHHMDAPYMPGELEQRNGRGQRQGNQWNTVLEYRYMTDRLDGKRWQILAVKQRFITAFMKSRGDTRTIEGEAAAEEQSDILESFSEAAGDPRVLQRVKLQGKQDSLKNKERIYTRGIADMKREIRSQKDRAVKGKEALAKLDPKIVADTLQAQREIFKATIDGKSFDKRADAIEAANKFIEDNVRLGTDKPIEVGTYAGVQLRSVWDQFDSEPKVIMDLGGQRFAGKGIAGLEAVMRNFPKFIESSQADIDKANTTVKNLEKALDQPFGQAQDLERNIKQLADLQKDLEMNPVPPPAWLRQGAPMDSEVYRNKAPFIVTGHRYDSNGWFVMAEDSKGQVAIPYLEAKDASGMALYDEKAFVAPEVTENKRGKDNTKPDGKNDNELEIDIEADRVPAKDEQPKYSKTNPAKGNTVTTSQQVISALQKHFGKDAVAALIKSGKLRVRSLNDFVNADGRLLIPSDAEGFYYDGKVVLIADNLTADNAVATLLHEMGGHAGIQSMLDPQTYMGLMANFDALVKSGNKYAVRAKERAEASTDSDSEARDEYIPYLITEYAQASERGGAIGVIKRFVNRVMAGVRAWVRNHTGVQLKMTPNDMVQLAERMVKRLSEQSATDMTIADVENMPAAEMQFSGSNIPSQQVAAIRKQYKGSASWMKAPNGEPTNLNEQQWLQARTPHFKDWFGDWEDNAANASKVVDTNGEPLVMYHGTNQDFWAFDMDRSIKGRNNGMRGMFFSDNAELAASYSVDTMNNPDIVEARRSGDRAYVDSVKARLLTEATTNADANTKAVFVNSRTPLEQDMKGGSFWEANQNAAARMEINQDKWDGVINDNVEDNASNESAHGPTKVVISFDPTNIKSATDNVGMFNASNADIRYSNKPQFSRRYSNLGTDGKPVTAKEKALDKIALAQATTMSSKFGINLLLRRHLATPQHVALLNPVFKLFTDNIQSRIAYENNEAGLVQTLLPEIWDTRLVVGKKKAAMERVSTAIFDGTMADQVWTDSELETKFNHTRQDIGFYRRARRAIDKSVMNMTVDTLSSLAKGTKLVNMETIQRLKLAGMHPIFHNLALQQHMTDELQKLAKGGLITPKAEARMQKQLDAVFDVMAAVAGKYDKLVEDGYAPLMRFGHYAVEVRDKISNDLDLFELYETKGQQRKAIKELKERYDESQFSVGTGTLNPEGFKQFKNKGLSPETVQLFAAELGLDDDSGYQAYLKIAVSDRSALKRLIHRKKVPGYSEDMPRVLSSFVMSNARYSGRGLYNSEIERSIQNIEDGNLQNEAQKVFENIENPQEEFAQQRSLMFHYFMGFSPAFFFLNLTQPFTQTIPKLTAYVGAGKGHAYMAQALGIVGKNMGASAIEMGKKVAGMPTPNWRGFEDKLPAWVKKEDYLRMAREGHLDPQNIYMIKGLERGKGGVASGIWGNIESAAGWFAEVSESMNRRSTMIAAFRVAHDMGDAKLKAKGFDSKYDFAVSIIQQTQGIYNKGNRSGLARGNGKLGQYGPLILVFKQFTINYTEQMIRHGKDKEAKSLAVAMMWQFALAGMLGLPFADDLRDLFEGIAYRVFGKAFNLPDYLEGLLGKSNADALMYGLASEKGRIDLFGRSSLGNIIPGTDVIRPGPTDWAEILGASSGFYESFFSAASMAADGHYKDALITASPRYVRDAASGAEIALTGSYRNTKGDKIMDLDKTDAVIKSMAFNPSNNARPGRDRSNAYNMKNMLKAKTDYFSKHLAEAMYQENDERLDELYNEMDAWNERNAEHFNVDIDKIEKSAEKRVERKDFGSAERQNVQDSLAQRQDDLAGT